MNKDIINGVSQALLLAIILGAYGFMWSVNNRLTVMETATDEDHARSHFMIECKLQIAEECRAEDGPGGN